MAVSTILCNDAKKFLPLAVVVAIGVGTACAQQPGSGAAAQPKPDARAARAAIYDKAADAQVQVAKACELATKDNKRILLMFGGDWCGWCHKLHNLFASNPEIRKTLSNEYVVVMIDTASKNASSLLDRCKSALTPEEQKKGMGYPFLAVLDAGGNIVKAQPTDVLEEGDHHDPKRVLDFLTQYRVAPQDAKIVLEEALSRATSTDKRVFLAFGAPWCGWCHRLDDWLKEPAVAAILDRDFVVIKIDIDRMTGGKNVMGRYRSSETGGIPWYTILDSVGKSLGTADGPDGNIGYPFKPKEIDQFMALLKAQSRHLDEGQLEKLHRSLVDAADRIAKQRGH
jgi:thioredoxin-related protein